MGDDNSIREDLVNILRDVAITKQIDNYELTPNLDMSYGNGFVAQFYTGQVKNKDTGNIVAVAIKKSPPYADNLFNLLFKNENLFYEAVFPALDIFQKENVVSEPFRNIPHFFCANLEPKKEYISMENLTPLGFVLHDKTKYFTEEQIRYIFRVYGRFHALSFAFKKQKPEEYRAILNETVNVYMSVAQLFLKHLINSVTAAFNALDSDKEKNAHTKVKMVLDNFKDTFINSCQYGGKYSCITHGDCWSNNMLFKFSDSGQLEDVKLIDFQLIRESTPIHDLSYFFYSGGSKEHFDKLESYLEIYYKSFSEFARELGNDPKELLPFDVLKAEWKQHSLLGIFMGIYLWQIKLIPQVKFQDLATDKETSIEDKGKHFEKLMNEELESRQYKDVTKAILLHAVKYEIIK